MKSNSIAEHNRFRKNHSEIPKSPSAEHPSCKGAEIHLTVSICVSFMILLVLKIVIIILLYITKTRMRFF